MTKTTQEQHLAFLASFSSAVGMAQGHVWTLMGQPVRRTVQRWRWKAVGSAAHTGLAELLGRFYPKFIRADASDLDAEGKEAARKTYGELVNELVAHYTRFCDEYGSANAATGQRTACLILARLEVERKCRVAIDKMVALVNQRLPFARHVDRLFQYCVNMLAVDDRVEIVFHSRSLPEQLNGLDFSDEVVREVINRLQNCGLLAWGSGYSEEPQESTPSLHVRSFEWVEDSLYGLTAVPLDWAALARL